MHASIPNNPFACYSYAFPSNVDRGILYQAPNTSWSNASSMTILARRSPQATAPTSMELISYHAQPSQISANQDLSFEDGGCAVLLPLDFVPSAHDVIIGRGKACSNHPGNARLANIVRSTLHEYFSAKARSAKSSIIHKAMTFIKESSPSGAGFVKKDENSGRWYDAGEFLARERTSQAFRDALAHRYRSSRLSKKTRRGCLNGRDADSSTESSASAACTSGPKDVDKSESSGDGMSLKSIMAAGMKEAAAGGTADNAKSLLSDLLIAFETYAFDGSDDPFEPTPLA